MTAAPHRIGVWASILYVAIVGNMFIALSPIFWSGFNQYLGFDDARIGEIMSSEFFGATLATISGILYMHRERLNLRTVAYSALAVYVVGNYATPLFFAHPHLLRAVRFVCGFSSGTTFLATATAITGLQNASRLIAVFYGAPYITGTIFQPIMQQIFRTWGFHSAFTLIAVAAAASPVLFSHFPRYAGRGDETENDGNPPRSSILLLVLLSLGLLLQYIANSGIWLFFARIGAIAGHDEQTTANIVGLGTGMALVGTAGAAVLARKLNPLYGIVVGTAMIIVSSVTLHFSRRLAIFAGSVAMFNVMITFITPFYFLLMVKIFHPAKAVIVGNICLMLGFALGPLLIGYTATDGHFSTSINATIGIFVASIGFVLTYAVLSRRESRR